MKHFRESLLHWNLVRWIIWMLVVVNPPSLLNTATKRAWYPLVLFSSTLHPFFSRNLSAFLLKRKARLEKQIPHYYVAVCFHRLTHRCWQEVELHILHRNWCFCLWEYQFTSLRKRPMSNKSNNIFEKQIEAAVLCKDRKFWKMGSKEMDWLNFKLNVSTAFNNLQMWQIDVCKKATWEALLLLCAGIFRFKFKNKQLLHNQESFIWTIS